MSNVENNSANISKRLRILFFVGLVVYYFYFLIREFTVEGLVVTLISMLCLGIFTLALKWKSEKDSVFDSLSHYVGITLFNTVVVNIFYSGVTFESLKNSFSDQIVYITIIAAILAVVGIVPRFLTVLGAIIKYITFLGLIYISVKKIINIDDDKVAIIMFAAALIVIGFIFIESVIRKYATTKCKKTSTIPLFMWLSVTMIFIIFCGYNVFINIGCNVMNAYKLYWNTMDLIVAEVILAAVGIGTFIMTVGINKNLAFYIDNKDVSFKTVDFSWLYRNNDIVESKIIQNVNFKLITALMIDTYMLPFFLSSHSLYGFIALLILFINNVVLFFGEINVNKKISTGYARYDISSLVFIAASVLLNISLVKFLNGTLLTFAISLIAVLICIVILSNKQRRDTSWSWIVSIFILGLSMALRVFINFNNVTILKYLIVVFIVSSAAFLALSSKNEKGLNDFSIVNKIMVFIFAVILIFCNINSYGVKFDTDGNFNTNENYSKKVESNNDLTFTAKAKGKGNQIVELYYKWDDTDSKWVEVKVTPAQEGEKSETEFVVAPRNGKIKLYAKDINGIVSERVFYIESDKLVEPHFVLKK